MARRNTRGRNKVNVKGRNESETTRFALLPQIVLLSPAYRSLDTVARALLIELVMIENGRNNGSLWLGVQDAIDRLGMADARPIMRAFTDLQNSGLITMTKEAHFSIKTAETSRARCWRINWLPANGKPASDEWRSFDPPSGSRERKRADKGLKAMARYRKLLSANKIPVVDFPATPPKKP